MGMILTLVAYAICLFWAGFIGLILIAPLLPGNKGDRTSLQSDRIGLDKRDFR